LNGGIKVLKDQATDYATEVNSLKAENEKLSAQLQQEHASRLHETADLREQVKQQSDGVTFWRDLVKAANDREQAFIRQLIVIHDAARIVFKQSKRQ
jgi:regulator of replication initiation timing